MHQESSMPEPPVGTVIFDLDGTLVDSAPDLADSLDILLGEKGLEPVGLDVTRQLIGHGIPNLVQSALALRGVAPDSDGLGRTVDRFGAIYRQRLTVGTRPYPGVPAALAELAGDGWRLVVATNKAEALARAVLADLGLIRHFAVVAGPDTFGVIKPHPDHLLRTIPDALRSRFAVMVGDSEVDVAAARAAGLPVVAVTYGYAKVPLQSLEPDALVDRFGVVPAAVARLAAQHETGRGPTR
jgi:phosphoglycolate phosphatase